MGGMGGFIAVVNFQTVRMGMSSGSLTFANRLTQCSPERPSGSQ